MPSLEQLPASKDGCLNVVIETPKGSRNKYKRDEELGLFKLSAVLPLGAVFPFDFGYVAGTKGEDGDALDVLLLMDVPAFPGCLVEARLVGVIEAEQSEKGKTEKNDRLIAVAAESRHHADVRSLDDLNDNLLKEIEHFFISYNRVKGKEFRPTGRFGPARANQLVEKGMKRHGPLPVHTDGTNRLGSSPYLQTAKDKPSSTGGCKKKKRE